MIFTSSLFFVLALSFTSASIQQGTIIEEKLTDKLSSVVVDKLVQVANNASTDNTSEAELDAKLLDTTRDILDQEMNPEVKELRNVSDDSPVQVAEITQNALPDDGKIASRGLLRIREKLKDFGPPPFMPPTIYWNNNPDDGKIASRGLLRIREKLKDFGPPPFMPPTIYWNNNPNMLNKTVFKLTNEIHG